MTQKFWVSTGLIKIARAFYKLVLFILLCQKKKRSFRSLLVSLFIKIHVCSIEFYEQFTCQTMSTASTSTRNPQRSSVKQFRPLYASLPNVFIAANSVDVTWGHISVVQAQFSCMEELLKSQVKWKYYISLVGQDFPLYDNKQIVKALQGLNNTNNIASFPMMDKSEPSLRTKFVYIFKQNHKMYRTNKPKGPPPHNITIYKGSTHIIAIREFVEFGLHGQIGKDFYEFLKDSKIPDETIYSSLQRHPGVPGGINGKQPRWIARALYWSEVKTREVCRGKWVRKLCWITFQDLSWALGEENKGKLFVHKIPFNFNEELIECILLARQGRKYDTSMWNTNSRDL